MLHNFVSWQETKLCNIEFCLNTAIIPLPLGSKPLYFIFQWADHDSITVC